MMMKFEGIFQFFNTITFSIKLTLAQTSHVRSVLSLRKLNMSHFGISMKTCIDV